jgi:cytochrome P450
MTSVLVHLNPRIFPDPHDFIPERWIENPRLSKYLVSFTKGSRQCIGINLAYAEIYVCLANLFWRFPGMKLYETTKSDVEIQADYYMLKASGKGVRVALG